MRKGIYTYYKERLIEIGGNNKCLYLKGIRKGIYDIGRILEGRSDKVAEFVQFLWSGGKYPMTLIGTREKKAILENLRNTRTGKTTLLIAHRVSTIEQMDKIIFVDEGKIAAVGNYAQLYSSCKDFKNLVDLQKLDDAGDSAVGADDDKEVNGNA